MTWIQLKTKAEIAKQNVSWLKKMTLRQQNLQLAVIILDLFRFMNAPAIVNI